MRIKIKSIEEWKEEQEYYNDTPTRVLNDEYEDIYQDEGWEKKTE